MPKKPIIQRRKKRAGSRGVPAAQFSKLLQDVNLKICSGDNASALISLNRLAVGEKIPKRLGKILSLTALSELKLGRYAEAAKIFSQAKEQLRTASDPAWIGAAIGQVGSLLKSIQTKDAILSAVETVRLAKSDDVLFAKVQQTPADELVRNNGMIVGPRPVRLTTILTRFGNLFLQEGYIENANDFYREAISIAPNGASRARQGLSKIAIANGKFEDAERFSRESLQTGRFQAKTLHSWALYYEARQKRGLAIHDAELFASMLGVSGKSVRNRAIVVVVESLRKWSDPAWKRIASEWISKPKSEFDPIFQIELSKVLLAEAKVVDSDPNTVVLAAQNILKQPMTAPSEMVGLAKTLALFSLRASGDAKVLQQTLKLIQAKVSIGSYAKVVHSASLGAMLAGRQDVARDLLTTQLGGLLPSTRQWRISQWALARMEGAVKNHSVAAAHFLRVAEQSETPPRFQIQGILEWLLQLQKSGISPDIAQTEQRLKAILARVEDYSLLLDAARQLALAGNSFTDLKNLVAAAGSKGAKKAFQEATDPKLALEPLLHLARRQYYELFMSADIHQFWNSLPMAKREWLWTQDERFWEYMSLVILSYQAVDNAGEAENLTIALLSSNTIPAHGVTHIAAAYADLLLIENDYVKAKVFLDKAVAASPFHRLCANAYYWRALHGRNAGDKQTVIVNAQMIRRCFGTRPSFGSEWALDSRAILLLGETSNNSNIEEQNRYSKSYLATQLETINEDSTNLR